MRYAGRCASIAALVWVVGGCASSTDDPDVKDSWVYQRAEEFSDDQPGYPRLTDVPQMPADLRSPAEWDKSIAELEQLNIELDALAERKRAQSAASED